MSSERRSDVDRRSRAETATLVLAALIGAITVIGWGVALVTSSDWFGRSFAIDFGIYMDAVDRWLASGAWYLDRQLHGPYPIELGDVLYPPVLLYLLIPFRVLGPWLWWVVPAGILAWVVWRHRPAPWALLAIALCLAWPYSPAKYIFGNPVIWAAAAVAVGTVWHGPAALAIIKPTILPFALFGVRDRRWWYVVAGLGLASLPVLGLTLIYPQVLLDAQPNPIDGRGGPFYSITEFPLVAIGVIAWLGRRRPADLAAEDPMPAVGDMAPETTSSVSLLDRAFRRPLTRGRIWLPAPGILALAMIGASLLLIVAVYRWPIPADELSYYNGARRLIEGVPLYDPTATVVTPYEYRYPPPLAQSLVPFALIMSPAVFTATWTVMLMGCLYWLAGRDIWIMFALIAFPPVAVELWFRNIHLVLAVLLVLGLRRWSGFFSIGASIKFAPGLGIVYLAVRRRWREAAVAVAVGLGILAVSYLLNPAAWAQFADITLSRGAMDESGFVAIPYALRFAAGVGLAVIAGVIKKRRWSEALLIVAVTIALPTLWFTALSTLAALYLVLRPDRDPAT